MATRSILQLTESPAQEGISARYLQRIGRELYLFDSIFNGKTYVHVRKLVNEKFPTKDGISLTLRRCNELYTSLTHVDIAVAQMERNEETFYRKHLGGNWLITVQTGFKCVDIRKFWLPEGATELRATRKGVSLTFPEYKELRNGLRTLDSFVPELKDVVPCYVEPDHHTNECRECSPV